MEQDDTVIQQLWDAEISILDCFHRICMKNNLRYSLFYGTLIGAVRHKGFIPWDDDIDVAMPREDYEKFIELWKKEEHDGFILQDQYTDADYTNTFAKIRKDHTAFVQFEDEKKKKYHKGIFIDVFPFDRVASSKLSRYTQFASSAVNLLYSREFTSGSKGVIGLTEKVLLYLPQKWHVPLREIAGKAVKKWNGNENAALAVFSTIKAAREYYPADMFDNLEFAEFNGKTYCVVRDKDTVLKVVYGDYMQLPPESERVWRHHPVVLSFDHNYEN